MVVSWALEQRWIDSCDAIREIVVLLWLVLLPKVGSYQLEGAEECRAVMLCLWLGSVRSRGPDYRFVQRQGQRLGTWAWKMAAMLMVSLTSRSHGWRLTALVI